MPIVVKNYIWTQSSKTINVRVPVSNGYRENVDIFTTDSYIKANFSPFIFEVFLLYDVDSKKSSCVVKDDVILFDLVKKEELEWECLEKDLTKPEKMKLKQEILEKCQEEAKQESEDRRIKKSQLDRFTVGQAMEIDTKQHALMDSRRNSERNKAMNALEEWRVNISEKGNKTVPDKAMNGLKEWRQNVSKKATPPERSSGVTITELPSSEDEDKKVDSKIEQKTKKSPVPALEDGIQSIYSRNEQKTKKISAPQRPVKTPVKSEFVEEKKKENAKRVLPKLRDVRQLEITHTPRSFPTPSRESAVNEEQAWLKNMTLARRATGFVSEDLRPEEQDPQWCKEKGDEFFRNGNFLGAISAYSHGITLSDKLPTLFNNRSAAHFALGNFNKCLNDCSTALELMQPACEGNRRSRAKCIARRAAALARLGYLNKAIGEMKAAAKLLPDDEKIKKDVYDMERAWEQDPDSD